MSLSYFQHFAVHLLFQSVFMSVFAAVFEASLPPLGAAISVRRNDVKFINWISLSVGNDPSGYITRQRLKETLI